MKLYDKKSEYIEIGNYDTLGVDLRQICHYNLYFSNPDFLSKSQGALRDLTRARLQTNPRLLKKILEISDEALIPKIKNIENRKLWHI